MQQPQISNKLKKALNIGQSGKGDQPRKIDMKKFSNNYKQINWSKK